MTEQTRPTTDDLFDSILAEPNPTPDFMPIDMAEEYTEYVADGHADAVYWTFTVAPNVYNGSALWLPAHGRLAIQAGSDSTWGDCHSEQEMETCLIEWMTNPAAWEARN